MPQVRLKLSTTICCDGGWDTEVSDPTRDESMDSRGSCDVWRRKGLKPASKTIHTCKEVRVSLTRRQWSNKVNVYVVKPGIWHCKCTNGCDGVLMNLSSLALNTRAGPFTNICVDPWPDIPCEQSEARMGEVF